MKKWFILTLILAASWSCVSTRKFNAMKAQALQFENEYDASRAREAGLQGQNAQLSEEIASLKQEKARLENEYAALDQLYKKLLSEGAAEAARMLRQLEQNQRDLEKNQLDLQTKASRLEELEQMLRAREESIASIRRKVADALLGFDGKGLSIYTRDSKVYVSMEDKLLFRSGSFVIDPNGAQAVRDLAVVLAQNPDINIMVEGHTDDVPYKPNGNLQDNLDLSVKRATTVVRLLLTNKEIDPVRVSSVGRGEWLPLVPEKSTEARAKNRRTEIILTPKIDELMRLLDR